MSLVWDKSNWQKKESLLFLNPRLPEKEQMVYKRMFAEFKDRLTNHVFLATSGTTGELKLVVLSKKALEVSASSVNKYLQITKDDIWLASLPIFHVGGLSINLRGKLSNSKVISYWEENRKWNPKGFVEFIDHHNITITSMVPTQLYDLVENSLTAPSSLRLVLLGGDTLSLELYNKARKLKWPVLPTFGSSECGSQVATAGLESLSLNKEVTCLPSLQILPHVSAQKNEKGFLQYKSEALFSGYIKENNGNDFLFSTEIEEGGWFTSQDCGEVIIVADGVSKELVFNGRSSDFAKIKGERVNLNRLNQLFLDFISSEKKEEFLILAENDKRSGQRLILFSTMSAESLQVLKNNFNKTVAPFERIEKVCSVDQFPRSELGKVLKESLLKNINI